MISLPSGDQSGTPTWGPPKKVNCRGFEPSLSQIQTSRLPDREETKTILFPSGEYCGSKFSPVEAINLVGGALLPFDWGTSYLQMFELNSVCVYARRRPSRESEGK